ncbi:MAG: hypothetical protein C0399_04955 [Syntrophus sp. (in: bacteria)]|nr:hypothetical protein [Syntrophus sp. (in: bacteria)]
MGLPHGLKTKTPWAPAPIAFAFLKQTRVQAAKVIKVIGRKSPHDKEIKKENTFIVKENRLYCPVDGVHIYL